MIDEAILYETFDKLADLPFDVLQVDDGWQMDMVKTFSRTCGLVPAR